MRSCLLLLLFFCCSSAFGQHARSFRSLNGCVETRQVGTKTCYRTEYDEIQKTRQATRMVPEVYEETYTELVPRQVAYEAPVFKTFQKIVEYQMVPTIREIEVDCAQQVSTGCTRRSGRNWQRDWRANDRTRRNIQFGMMNIYTVDSSDDDEVVEADGATFRRRFLFRTRR